LRHDRQTRRNHQAEPDKQAQEKALEENLRPQKNRLIHSKLAGSLQAVPPKRRVILTHGGAAAYPAKEIFR
jgi:hypothetical protein